MSDGLERELNEERNRQRLEETHMIAQLVLNGIRNDIESAMSGLSNKLMNEVVTRIADRKLDADAEILRQVKNGISEVLNRALKMGEQTDYITKTLGPLITGLPGAIRKHIFANRRELLRSYGFVVAVLAGILILMVLFFVVGWPHQWGLLARLFGCRFAWFRTEGGFGLVPLVH